MKKPQHYQENAIKTLAKKPKQYVSVDQMESFYPGSLPTLSARYTDSPETVSTVYVDQATHKTFVYHQASTSASETVMSKVYFERAAHTEGVEIKSYKANNGACKTKQFMQHVAHCEQGIKFSGVRDHQKIGIAKRHICTIYNMARSMLINAIYK